MPNRPSNGHLITRLRSLSLCSPPTTALFYARLWHVLFPPANLADHDSLHTLALCLLQTERPYSALHLVRDTANGDHVMGSCYGCAFIVAKCCENVGRFSEGQEVLNRAMRISGPSSGLSFNTPPWLVQNFILPPWTSTVGLISPGGTKQYRKALQEDSWLWEAFTGLCDAGETISAIPPHTYQLSVYDTCSPPSPDLIFPDPSPKSKSRPPTLSPNPMRPELGYAPSKRQMSPLVSSSSSLFTPDIGAGSGVGSGGQRLGLMGNVGSWETPSVLGDTTFDNSQQPPPSLTHSRRPFPSFASMLPASIRSIATPTSNVDPASSKPPAMKRPRGAQGKRLETPQTQLNGHGNKNGKDLMVIDPHGDHDGAVRRSRRLNTTAGAPSKAAPREKRSTRSHSATSSASTATDLSPLSHSIDDKSQQIADDWLRDVVRRCGRAYRALSMFQCPEVIGHLEGLPEEVQSGVWGLEMMARALYEMAHYTAAQRVYGRLLALDPHRLNGMEHLSTLLWHLSDAPALSHLSQTLMSVSREAPQTWIAAGNCFSVQKDHDEAMRCFRRATQVAPGCAYAWTLCGYEAVEMEEYERAVAFFRTAIRTDARHYNAWYGMGLVYLKTGKPKHAEHHFRRAAELNPTNAVLLCCIGMVLEQMDNVIQALEYYDKAVRFSPNSPMVVFKRIRALVSLGRIEESLPQLEHLSRHSPDEANVFFLLGKCYLRLDRKSDAAVSFTHARELQPKLESSIKAAFENGGLDIDEEVE
ncbi:hypothetical protein TREMEDRAFT_28684 [Tremella mesenterica DSM 1558]|uniref:uncharacterized protein n=1 Tax=Tremella mesenterica (strain ATCC 24925 / CBS 8224 / DSM 1558 / NBRC 9311 / NRRL Y-6157 / RJB 2259-6 / UBC 559-6) TaxID=578456 RepID=UPI0003F4A1DF|nr:uncharacterized protein TREMEDRAFT_28684 [Tremella mesenterica DSM 1558]EIW70360.1 hypothetical protein TREMEDRAFT_28684 [Tremella mesenterica DSM 1558]